VRKSSAGTRFERELIQSAAAQGMHVHKLPVARMQGYMAKSIYDLLILYDGTYAGIECKVLSKPGSFPFSRVNDRQIISLEEVHKNGGRGLILINIRIPRKQEIRVLPITMFTLLLNTSKRRSISKEELDNLPCITKKGKFWDVEEIFKMPYP